MKIQSGSISTEAFNMLKGRKDTEQLIYSLWLNLPTTFPAESCGQGLGHGRRGCPHVGGG